VPKKKTPTTNSSANDFGREPPYKRPTGGIDDEIPF
jgi:hypothetical protein